MKDILMCISYIKLYTETLWRKVVVHNEFIFFMIEYHTSCLPYLHYSSFALRNYAEYSCFVFGFFSLENKTIITSYYLYHVRLMYVADKLFGYSF